MTNKPPTVFGHGTEFVDRRSEAHYAAGMTMVSVHEAVPQLARLVDRAYAGEEIVIAKAGVRCVRLVPLETPPPRELGRHRDRDGEVPDSFFEPLDEAELVAWE